jgi:uncharacterized protein DUF1801
MAELKTVQTDASVEDFLSTVPSARRADASALCALMAKATGAEPTMWGSSIVGFGTYHYVYASGKEGDWPPVGFSPRKTNLTVYVGHGLTRYADQLAKLGSHTTGKGCIYIKHLAEVDAKVLATIVRTCFKAMDGKMLRP